MIAGSARNRATRNTVWFVATLSGALLLYNSGAQRIPGYNTLYVPMNLIATAVLVALALRFGLSTTEVGLARAHLRNGATLGISVAIVVGLVLAIAVATPALHPLLDDARVAGIGPELLVYRALIRIPLGTALFEEVAFRGVLLGAWARLTTPLKAAAGSSVVFGLWHIRPTIDLLDANLVGEGELARLGLVAAAIALTAAAGYLFCLLRLHSRSLLAPFVAHAAINSFAIIAAYVVIG